MNEERYTTRDRYEIYSLLASHCGLEGFEADEGIIYFTFKNKQECVGVLAKLLSKELTVAMHDVISAIRDCQSIFNSK